MGTDEVTAYGEGKDWMSDLASAVNSALGGTPIPATMQGGTQTITTTGTVTVNGTVEVGIDGVKTLVINEDGTVDQQTGGITFTTSTESESNDLMMEYQYWTALENVYAGTTAGSAYQTQADYVAAEMSALRPQHFKRLRNRLPHVLRCALYHGRRHRCPGRDDQRQRHIPCSQQTGTLDASGNVSVTIDNESPDFLRIEGIDISDSAGGQVLFNYNRHPALFRA